MIRILIGILIGAVATGTIIWFELLPFSQKPIETGSFSTPETLSISEPDFAEFFGPGEGQPGENRSISDLEPVHHYSANLYKARHWCVTARCAAAAYSSATHSSGVGPQTRLAVLREAFDTLADRLETESLEHATDPRFTFDNAKLGLAYAVAEAALEVDDFDTVGEMLALIPEREVTGELLFPKLRVRYRAETGRMSDAQELLAQAQSELAAELDLPSMDTPGAISTFLVELIDTSPMIDNEMNYIRLFSLIEDAMFNWAMVEAAPCDPNLGVIRDLTELLNFQTQSFTHTLIGLDGAMRVYEAEGTARNLRRLCLIDVLSRGEDAEWAHCGEAAELRVPIEIKRRDWPVERIVDACLPNLQPWHRERITGREEPWH